jgi:leader peptidase (prepilin peptidase)/N-methyltransferase
MWLVASSATGGALGWQLGLSPWHVVVAATSGVLVWLSALDFESRLLPDRIVLPTSAAVLVAATVLTGAPLAHWAAALISALVLGLAVQLQPRSLGMGDAKLALLLGALLGGAVLNALAIGFCLLAAAGLVLIARHGRGGLGRHLPLGPFLAAGALAVLLF